MYNKTVAAISLPDHFAEGLKGYTQMPSHSQNGSTRHCQSIICVTHITSE